MKILLAMFCLLIAHSNCQNKRHTILSPGTVYQNDHVTIKKEGKLFVAQFENGEFDPVNTAASLRVYGVVDQGRDYIAFDSSEFELDAVVEYFEEFTNRRMR